jgi:hypothetical protein
LGHLALGLVVMYFALDHRHHRGYCVVGVAERSGFGSVGQYFVLFLLYLIC